MTSSSNAWSRKRSLSPCSSHSSDSDGSDGDCLSNTAAPGQGRGPAYSSQKLQRIDLAGDKHSSTTAFQDVRQPYVCALPPLCTDAPTSFTTANALQSHYNSHHAHVCSVRDCREIFPDEHFLALHIAECHDPLVAIKREQGQKTYRCFIESCPKVCSTPKKRRLHLVAFHKYPKEYFFSLPKYGMSQLYTRFGEAASLVRSSPLLAAESQSGARQRLGTASQSLSASPAAQQEVDEEPMLRPRGRLNCLTQTDENPQIEEDSAANAAARSLENVRLVPNSVRFSRGRTKTSQTARTPAASHLAERSMNAESSLQHDQG